MRRAKRRRRRRRRRGWRCWKSSGGSGTRQTLTHPLECLGKGFFLSSTLQKLTIFLCFFFHFCCVKSCGGGGGGGGSLIIPFTRAWQTSCANNDDSAYSAKGRRGGRQCCQKMRVKKRQKAPHTKHFISF